MDWKTIAAYKLGQELEWINARQRAQGRRGTNAMQMYDPHAATELGSLIYKRMTTPPARKSK